MSRRLFCSDIWQSESPLASSSRANIHTYQHSSLGTVLLLSTTRLLHPNKGTEVVVRRQKGAPSANNGGAPSLPSPPLPYRCADLSMSEKPAARDQHQRTAPVSAATDIMPPLTDTSAFPPLTASRPPAVSQVGSGRGRAAVDDTWPPPQTTEPLRLAVTG